MEYYLRHLGGDQVRHDLFGVVAEQRRAAALNKELRKEAKTKTGYPLCVVYAWSGCAAVLLADVKEKCGRSAVPAGDLSESSGGVSAAMVVQNPEDLVGELSTTIV